MQETGVGDADDPAHDRVGGAFPAVSGRADQDGPDPRRVLGVADPDVRQPGVAPAVGEVAAGGGQERHQERGGVCLGVGPGGVGDVTGESVERGIVEHWPFGIAHAAPSGPGSHSRKGKSSGTGQSTGRDTAP